MITLITSNGITFEIAWIGVSGLDGVLRFSIINGDISQIMQTFTIPENCQVLTRDFDGVEQVFEGYIVFRGIQINYDNTIMVSLSKV